jgi:hypothetical protein
MWWVSLDEAQDMAMDQWEGVPWGGAREGARGESVRLARAWTEMGLVGWMGALMLFEDGAGWDVGG